MSRALVLLLILPAAACATRNERTWFTYQVAGETAALHARHAKATEYLARAEAEAVAPRERARTSLALARLARDLGDLPRARAEIGEARSAAAALPDLAPERVRVELEAAWLELAEGESVRAAASFALVEHDAGEQLGVKDPAFGYAAAGRGEALRRTGDTAGARLALADALDRFRGSASAEHVTPSDPLGLVAALTSLGTLQREAGELGAARGSLREAAVLASDELGTDHPRLADVLAELAQVELSLGDSEAARRAADRAVVIADGNLPAGHPTRLAAGAARERCRAAP